MSRVLIADDYPHTAESLARLLRRQRFEVEIALNGQQAIEIADEFRPNIALLDLGMPKPNGYDIAQWLRRQRWANKILLVAISGYGQEDDRARARAAGFDAHLLKPVEYARLLELFARFHLVPTAVK